MSFKNGLEAQRTIHVFLSYSSVDLDLARTAAHIRSLIGRPTVRPDAPPDTSQPTPA